MTNLIQNRRMARSRSSFQYVCCALLGACLVALTSTADPQAEFDSTRPSKLNPAHVVGAESCGECHEQALQTLAMSSHHEGDKLFATPAAQAMLKKLKISGQAQIKEACASCHYTVQVREENSAEMISSVSCESCHGSGKRWLNLHWKGEGKKLARNQVKASKRGLVRPSQTLAMTRRCLECHFVADDKLVRVGGHPDGSDFEVVKYLTGEVQHNFLRATKFGENVSIPSARRRKYYVLGRVSELEQALRIFATLESRDSPHAMHLGSRILKSYGKIKAIRKLAPQLTRVRKLLAEVKLARSSKEAIIRAADSLDTLAKELEKELSIPQPDQFDAMLPASGIGKLANFEESR